MVTGQSLQEGLAEFGVWAEQSLSALWIAIPDPERQGGRLAIGWKTEAQAEALLTLLRRVRSEVLSASPLQPRGEEEGGSSSSKSSREGTTAFPSTAPLSAGGLTPAAAVAFLTEAARYFEKRPTGGEDSAFWANTANAENCRKIAAMLARVGEEDGWQPIETAPKDGTKVDLWLVPTSRALVATEPYRIADAWFSAGNWWVYENNDDQRLAIYPTYITHWRSLPAPPNQEGGGD